MNGTHEHRPRRDARWRRDRRLRTLVDPSAWIEYLRDTRSPACEGVATLLEIDSPVATRDTTLMEVLAGGSTARHENGFMHFLGRCCCSATRPLFDSTGAINVYRACRHSGFTPRTLNACIIATIAFERDPSVLHADHDFASVVEVTGLRVES